MVPPHPRSPVLSLLLAAVLSLSAAHAQDTPIDDARMERALRWGNVGLTIGAAGPPIAFGGLLLFAGGLVAEAPLPALGGVAAMGVGGAGILVGPPILAASAVRSAHLTGTPVALGATAWSLWGVSLLSGSVAQTVQEEGGSAQAASITSLTLGVGGYIGSLVTGKLQLNASVDAWRQSTRTSLRFIPTPDGRLVVTGRF